VDELNKAGINFTGAFDDLTSLNANDNSLRNNLKYIMEICAYSMSKVQIYKSNSNIMKILLTFSNLWQHRVLLRQFHYLRT
jgi:hypothetical protein